MEKTTLALTLLMVAASFGENFSGGIKAGANFSDFTGGDFDAWKNIDPDLRTALSGLERLLL
ncbi:MAG: hypothetical protein ACXWV1_07480 [Chitinophagaceae bacterium]